MWDFLRLWGGRPRPMPLFTQQVDVSADAASKDADYTANPLRGIYVGGSGSVYVKALEDEEYFERAVFAGGYIPGIIVAVQKAPTATKLVGHR